MTPSDRKVFDNNYLLYGLPQESKDELAKMASYVDCPARQTIIGEDSPDVDLIIILRGQVGIYKGTEKLAEAGPGSVLGEIALVDNLPRSANAMTVTSVSIAKLDGKELRKYMYLNREPGFLMLANLTRVLSSRLRSISQQVEDLKGQARDPWQHAL